MSDFSPDDKSVLARLARLEERVAELEAVSGTPPALLRLAAPKGKTNGAATQG